jgi:prepilin-type N-terminal cleavage/methylation domain-containing protein
MGRSSRGFTVIELVVVITLIGLLAAVGLPRLASLRTEAHRASVGGTAGGFQSAVALVHLTWVAKGLTAATDNLPGFGAGDVDVNTTGYPTDTSGGNTINGGARCMRVWNGILTGPPSIATAAGATTNYRATRSGQTCIYTYLRDTAVARSFRYNALTGQITITNP